jgi:hypothetical protein
MPFQKGQSGNPGGKSSYHCWRSAIERALKRRGKQDMLAIDALADKFLDLVEGSGDVMAYREFGDRMDGKPAQAIEHSGMIASTHEELLKQLDSMDDTDREDDTASAEE